MEIATSKRGGWRRHAGIVLTAPLGLAAASCSTDDDDVADGPTRRSGRFHEAPSRRRDRGLDRAAGVSSAGGSRPRQQDDHRQHRVADAEGDRWSFRSLRVDGRRRSIPRLRRAHDPTAGARATGTTPCDCHGQCTAPLPLRSQTSTSTSTDHPGLARPSRTGPEPPSAPTTRTSSRSGSRPVPGTRSSCSPLASKRPRSATAVSAAHRRFRLARADRMASR